MVMALGLAACGGGGGGATPTGVISVPTATPTTGPTSGNRATTSISFRVTGQLGTSSSKRSPQYISPGQDRLTFLVDGTKEVDNLHIANTPFTSADGNVKVAVTGDALNPAYYTVTLSIDVIPGIHTFGVEINGNAPAVILGEGQATYALQPGPNTPQAMALRGPVGSGYIMCDTDGHIAENNNCANSFNTTTGKYTLTAVAADFNGFPIPNQVVGGNPLTFDNGTFTVVETGTSTGVISLSNNGPFNNPGSQLTAQPSGGFFVPGTFSYGQPFNIVCNKLGTATVGIHNNQQGPGANALTGETYTYFDPANNFPTSGNYPGAGTVARGSKWVANPAYHGGSNPNAVHDILTVNCDASLVLTIT